MFPKNNPALPGRGKEGQEFSCICFLIAFKLTAQSNLYAKVAWFVVEYSEPLHRKATRVGSCNRTSIRWWGLKEAGSVGGDEKSLDLVYILKVDATRITRGLHVGKEGSRIIPRFLAYITVSKVANVSRDNKF